MLIAMTFSVELFFSVVLGLGIGYTVFFLSADADLRHQHITTNPCCDFFEEHPTERDLLIVPAVPPSNNSEL